MNAVLPLAVALAVAAPAAAQPALKKVDGVAAPSAPVAAEVFDVESSALGRSQRVYVDLPPSFERSERDYPVIVVFDGQYIFADAAAAAAHLSANGQIPEAIVVGFEHVDRQADYTPAALELGVDGAQGEATAGFLADELLPALARDMRGRGPAVLVGYSQSAILVLDALAERPGVFDLGVAIDAPVHLRDLWLEGRLRERAATSDAPLRLQSVQVSYGWDDDAWAAFADSAPGAWTLERRTLDRETHQTMSYVGAYLGLRDLFADFSSVHDRGLEPGALLARYDGLPALYAGWATPPEEALRWAGEDFWIADDEAAARAALARWVAGYGESAATERLRAKIDAMAENPLDEPLADLLAAPRATAAEIAPFAGRWTGRAWGFGPETPIEVTFTIDGGRAAGEFVQAAGAATETRQPLDHVTRDGGVLRFGYMNGMRPRGLLLYEARLDGDVLTGDMTIAGVRFEMPNGMAAPVTQFELTREDGD